MSDWDPKLYLQYEEQRTQPCRELVARIRRKQASEILDLGCGPGNSTEAVMARFSDAQVTGVDSSPEMLAKARASYPQWRFVRGDLRTWTPEAPVGVIVSNAALQWLPDHAQLFPRLMGWLNAGGELAVQVPRSNHLPVLRLIAEVAAEGPWKERFDGFVAPYHVDAVENYYDWLCGVSSRVDLVEVSYYHVMPDPQAVVDWVKATGLRPWLERAGEYRTAFLDEYARRITAAYPLRADGTVLFEFRRLMINAIR